MRNIKEQVSRLRAADGTDLEVRKYFSDDQKPRIVFATGFGGRAKSNPLIDRLAEDYSISTLSPRNSGTSKGSLTLNNYVTDLADLVEDTTQDSGERPYIIGHSIGGYASARLLGEKPIAKKAFLLAPLIDINEQLPAFVRAYLRYVSNKESARGTFTLASFLGLRNNESGELEIASQRIDSDHFLEFIKSITYGEICDKKLTTPTSVALAGGSLLRLPISAHELERLKQVWEGLGANVDLYSESNHWFSGRWYNGAGNELKDASKGDLLNKITSFLR